MTKFQDQYRLWDQFRKLWPRARVAAMTLEEYTQVGSKDTFTQWIESRMDQMGSIWGGSSFKFGVYSRRDREDRPSDKKLSYSDRYAWYSSLGDSAEEAFSKVRDGLVRIIDLSMSGQLEAIDSVDVLGEVLRWKIAFHYQDPASPQIVDIFSRAPLAMYVGDTARRSMAELQRAAMARKESGQGILEFGHEVWEAWTRRNLDIWKLSHGPGSFAPKELHSLRLHQVGKLHAKTGLKQAVRFQEVPIGTLFFLCHGNSVQSLAQFTSAAVHDPNDPNWLQRDYRLLKAAIHHGRYTKSAKKWTPLGNSTFWQVGHKDLPEFEQHLLLPYFGIDLGALVDLASEPIETRHQDGGSGGALPPAGDGGHDFPGKSDEDRPCVNRIYHGPPGTGKTYRLTQLLKDDYGADEDYAEEHEEGTEDEDGGRRPRAGKAPKRFSFVTFHQSYGYEEFVEGLRPVLGANGKAGEVIYEIRSGAFKALCKTARKHPELRFAMVIDEINRGNISKIFGELITLIEPDKRDALDGSRPPVEVRLAYSGDSFSVPANVDIFGSMNTADRSIALLDTALRRRFEFVSVMPDTRAVKDEHEQDEPPLANLLVRHEGQEIDVRLMLETINRRIEALYDRDHGIGHAYFTPLLDYPSPEDRFVPLQQIFRHRILPLLEEYFFEDGQKIRAVLGDHEKDEAHRFMIEDGTSDARLQALFGTDPGLEGLALRPRYALQPQAFGHPSAYIGIYRRTRQS